MHTHHIIPRAMLRHRFLTKRRYRALVAGFFLLLCLHLGGMLHAHDRVQQDHLPPKTDTDASPKALPIRIHVATRHSNAGELRAGFTIDGTNGTERRAMSTNSAAARGRLATRRTAVPSSRQPSTVSPASFASSVGKSDTSGAKTTSTPVRCPAHHPADHGLVNTGRRALVFYTFTSHDNLQDRQIELDNYLFFQAHGVVAPDTPTALFSAVDYIVLRSDPSSNSATVSECADIGKNVRVLEVSKSPCDLCSLGRAIKALGGAVAVAESYEYIVVVNSGTRGPFYSEAPRGAGGPSPVTWIDDLALGGEKVYTGAIMTANTGSGETRPLLDGGAFGTPSSALLSLQPVLMAGCNERPLPPMWRDLMDSFDAELHNDTDTQPSIMMRKVIHVLQLASILEEREPSVATQDPNARRVDAAVVAGMHLHVNNTMKLMQQLREGDHQDERNVHAPPTNRQNAASKSKEEVPKRSPQCAFRSQRQLLKTILETPLPPFNETNSSRSPLDFLFGRSPRLGSRQRHTVIERPSSFCLNPVAHVSYPAAIRRPYLTAAQKAQLSPVVSGYLHEGHFFVRSLHHNETMVNMGHAAIVMSPEHDGAAGRPNSRRATKVGDDDVSDGVNPCTLIMIPSDHHELRKRQSVSPNVTARAAEDVVQCRHRRFVRPL